MLVVQVVYLFADSSMTLIIRQDYTDVKSSKVARQLTAS